MSSDHPSSDHHVVISADTHGGADLWDYKPYLASKYHDEFDHWAAGIEQAQRQQAERFKAVGRDRSTNNVGIDGDPEVDGDRNYSMERRLREQHADGVIAGVIFPNTQPPFAPASSSQFEAPAYRDNFEQRWAGLRAHNRWMLDHVGEAPGEWVGIAQIFLGDVEGSVKEIEWAAENGFRGGIIVPGAPPDSPFDPLYSKIYEPIWDACAANNMTLNHHAGGATPNFGSHFPTSLAVFMLEVSWWSHRALWHLMFAGVFERHPELRWVNTETGTAWVPDTLERLDNFYERMKFSKYGSESIFGGMAVAEMSLKPSEYWQRQCWVGASFLRPIEVEVAQKLGVDRVMWGSDYPHIEGSHPYTKEHLRLTFANMTEDETTQILTRNAAEVYGFDVDRLRPLAEQYCPTKVEVATPIDYADIPEEAKGCPGMNPLNQLQAV